MNQYDVDDVGKNINKEILWFHQLARPVQEGIEKKSTKAKCVKHITEIKAQQSLTLSFLVMISPLQNQILLSFLRNDFASFSLLSNNTYFVSIKTLIFSKILYL